MTAPGPVRASVTVPVDAQRAFAIFTDGLASWWPPEYTWSGAALELIAIDPREGGLCSEYGPHRFRCDWGRVLVYDPPNRLALTWQIGPTRVPQPDPAQASRIDVRFSPDGAATAVELVHSGFEHHGEGAEAYRDAMAADPGWPWLLRRYAGAAGA